MLPINHEEEVIVVVVVRVFYTSPCSIRIDLRRFTFKTIKSCFKFIEHKHMLYLNTTCYTIQFPYFVQV